MKPMRSFVAGYILITILSSVIIFQILLVFGLQVKGATWGGQLDAKPEILRLASAFAVLVLAFAISVVLVKMGKFRWHIKPSRINGLLWFFGAYFLLNTVGNLFSPGAIERFVMTPLALATSILFMLVARASFPEKQKT